MADAATGAKEIYAIGEVPPQFHVPEKMWAWAIRKERHGRPAQAMQLEQVPVPQVGEDEALVLVMAAGVNYNGVWAALGEPMSVLDVHKQPYHVAGSDASGIVWAVGSKVKRWKPGDEVVIHCNQDDGDDEECNGGDPMFSPSQKIWGYETTDGSFAQFCKVQARQLMPRPKHLTWEESACYVLTLATAYRMLFGWRPNVIRPGQNVLVWGASGGLGVVATQLCAVTGANAIGVISDEQARLRAQHGPKRCSTGISIAGANCRGEFENSAYMKSASSPADLEITGNRMSISCSRSGEATFPVSVLVCKRGGMVVICAHQRSQPHHGRALWMRQKRVQQPFRAPLSCGPSQSACHRRSGHGRGVPWDRSRTRMKM